MSRRSRDRQPTRSTLLQLAADADVHDPQIQKLLATALVTDNTALRQRVEKLLAAKAAHHQAHPFGNEHRTKPSIPHLVLGNTTTGSSVRLPRNALTQHLLTVGQSGAGKTTLFYNLMDQLDVPFWAFDLKQDYRHLITDHDDLLVLPWTGFRFNPLQPPPGVMPRRWAQVFIEIFGHATSLLSGSKNYLLRSVIELYQLYGLFDELSAPYPSLHELQQFLAADKINYIRKTSNYRDTVLNRLEAMTLTAGTVFDCSEGYPIEELLEQNVVFEFDGLGTDLQNFLMEILFAYVYEYRVAQNQRGGDLRHVFFLDEGKRIFSVYKERQDAAGIPEIDQLTAKMREFGEGLVVADQEASKLTDSIKANTYTKILLATGDAKQFHEMADSMHFTEYQRQAAQTLDIGEAIIQIGNQGPVHVTLPPYDLEKTVTDTELRDHQLPGWNQLTHEPRQYTEAFDNVIGGEETTSTEIPRDPPENQVDLTSDAERLLTDIVKHPFKQLSERYERFSSAYKGNKAKNELLDNRVVVERRLDTEPGEPLLLELTQRGREYAENTLELDTKQQGRGGIIHQYWQHRIKELLEEAGWTAKIELFDADVYANMAGTELVIEIAMGDNEREIDHVKHHLEKEYDTIWVVCRNDAVRDALQKRMDKRGLLDERVLFRLLRDIQSMDIDVK